MDTTSTTPAEASAPAADSKEVAFSDLGIAPQILKSLDYHKFFTPTPIQEKAIPVVATGRDVIGIAQTGTGKTMAFGIPIIQQLMLQGGHALILLPTRELAIQVEENLNRLTKSLNLKTAVLIGGERIGRQIRILSENPDIFIATPGRLNDLLNQRKISLSRVKCVVLDEADRMLDMGFEPQINEIMRYLPKERQTLMFSATMPQEIVDMVHRYQKDPERIEVSRAGTTVTKITQELLVVPKDRKADMLVELLEQYQGTVLVFSRTKHGATSIAKRVRAANVNSAELHSERTLQQRIQALEGFKNGRTRVLVATDIAARGIDVTGIELVLNYDLPDNPEDYVHRIGRTGRAGREGHAISFASPDQTKEVRSIERLTGNDFIISEKSVAQLAEVASGGGGRRRGRSGGGSGGGGGYGSRSGGGNQRAGSSFGGSGGQRGPSGAGSAGPSIFSIDSGPSGFTGPRSARKPNPFKQRRGR